MFYLSRFKLFQPFYSTGTFSIPLWNWSRHFGDLSELSRAVIAIGRFRCYSSISIASLKLSVVSILTWIVWILCKVPIRDHISSNFSQCKMWSFQTIGTNTLCRWRSIVFSSIYNIWSKIFFQKPMSNIVVLLNKIFCVCVSDVI